MNISRYNFVMSHETESEVTLVCSFFLSFFACIALYQITGVYGMNFINMPELVDENGYFDCWIAMGCMFAVSLTYTRYSKKGWSDLHAMWAAMQEFWNYQIHASASDCCGNVDEVCNLVAWLLVTFDHETVFFKFVAIVRIPYPVLYCDEYVHMNLIALISCTFFLI